jgi:hypothetical protein
MTNNTLPAVITTAADHFNLGALARVLEAHETDFEAMYDMVKHEIPERSEEAKQYAKYNWATADDVPADFYVFKDNGSSILAVAHLDTVGAHEQRTCHYTETANGPIVFSRALDDRLGAYVLAELLPSMGLTFDLLLTVGEEQGQSTAEFFEPSRHHDRQYNWVIEFDRGGTDVVLYQYHDFATERMVERTGARVSHGAFSDISYMEHLGIKCFNWGVGYRDYHGPRAHVWLDDMFTMVDYFVDFHAEHSEKRLPHEEAQPRQYGGGWSGHLYGSSSWGDRDYGSTYNSKNSREEAYYSASHSIEEVEPGEELAPPTAVVWTVAPEGSQCIEHEDTAASGEHWCGGTLRTTEIGVLCTEHIELYFG